jgi:pimeloyl-ACP methyl ester carboxylesterase
VTRWSSIPMRLLFGTVDGITIRFAQSEQHERQALLFGPWPESILAFAQMWCDLAGHAHLVALDLPGFGASERRDAILFPSAIGEFIIRVADTFGMDRPHLVAPSVSTAASLFTAARDPQRVATVTVGPGPALSPLAVGPDLQPWITMSDGVTDGASEPRGHVMALLSHLESHDLSDEVREDYVRSYEGDRFAGSTAYLRRMPEELPVLNELLATIEAPVQIIAGRHDRLIPWRNAELLHQRLPVSKLCGVDAGHFVWEEAAEEYSALVSTWWDAWDPP